MFVKLKVMRIHRKVLSFLWTVLVHPLALPLTAFHYLRNLLRFFKPQKKMPEKNLEPNLEADATKSSATNLPTAYSNDYHPLENVAILRHLFGLLNLPELMKYRFVSRTWNRLSLPYLRRRAGFVGFRDYVPDRGMRNPRHNLQDIFDFTSYLESDPGFSPTKFLVQPQRAVPNTVWNGLLRCVADTLTDLHFLLNFFPIPSLPEETCFPNLRRICISSVCWNPVDFQMSREFLLRIPELAPLLSELELVRVAQETFAVLCQLEGLFLQRVKLEAKHDEVDGQIVTQFLEGQRNTLHILQLDFYRVDHFNRLPPLSLPYLTSLQIKGNVFRHPVRYALQFPALKNLALDIGGLVENHSIYLNTGGRPAIGVESVRTPVQEKTALVIPKLFPNLKKLEVSSHPQYVLEMVGKLKQLEQLKIINSDANCSEESWHSLFNGFSDEELDLLKKKEIGEAEEMAFCEILEQMPFAALNQIRVLKLETTNMIDNVNPFFFSEAACRLIFLQMKALRELHLSYAYGRIEPPSLVKPGKALLEEIEKKVLVVFN